MVLTSPSDPDCTNVFLPSEVRADKRFPLVAVLSSGSSLFPRNCFEERPLASCAVSILLEPGLGERLRVTF
jgi:hypothetical protein